MRTKCRLFEQFGLHADQVYNCYIGSTSEKLLQRQIWNFQLKFGQFVDHEGLKKSRPKLSNPPPPPPPSHCGAGDRANFFAQKFWVFLTSLPIFLVLKDPTWWHHIMPICWGNFRTLYSCKRFPFGCSAGRFSLSGLYEGLGPDGGAACRTICDG